MRTLYQVFAIARTEFRFSVRRGWPVVGMAVVGLILTAGILLLTTSSVRDNSIPQEYVRYFVARTEASGIAMVWTGFLIFVPLILPVATAPTIPADRQYGVNELLRSTPITGTIYLAGKVLGVLAAVYSTAAIALMSYIILHIVLFGFANLGLYLELSILSGVPALLWASILGIMVGAAFPSRRWAILLAGLLGASGFALQTFLSTPPMSNPIDIPSSFVFRRYGLDYIPTTTIWQIMAAYSAILFSLLAMGTLARAWLKWKENF